MKPCIDKKKTKEPNKILFVGNRWLTDFWDERSCQ